MSDEDRERWDRRYSLLAKDAGASVLGADGSRAPSRLVLETLSVMAEFDRLGPGLSALDVACGVGRNSLLLADRGFLVDAVDVSARGLALARNRQRQLLNEQDLDANSQSMLADIRWLEADLDSHLSLSEGYDLILVIRYLDLALLEVLCSRLNPGGFLAVELFLKASDDEAAERAGPQNPDFLVAPGTLAAACSTLVPFISREGISREGISREGIGADGRREVLAQFLGRDQREGSERPPALNTTPHSV